jgi:GAF domain-containing protein
MLEREQQDDLISRTQEIMRQKKSAGTRLQRLCDQLREQVDHYEWFGFYLVVPGGTELALGPFSGEPTEHVRIPFGRGVCGQAAERKDTVLVGNVELEDNYLSCSPEVQSEIVVPVFHEERVIGEIDIDSHRKEPFDASDRAFLEQAAEIVSPAVTELVQELER